MDVIAVPSGIQYQNTKLTVEGHPYSPTEIYRLPDNQDVIIKATNNKGELQFVRWWANGYYGHLRASCARIPKSLQMNHHLFVDVNTEMAGDEPTSKTECAQFKLPYNVDSSFTNFEKLVGAKTKTIAGVFGGWSTLKGKEVTLLSESMADTNNHSQAIDLNKEIVNVAGQPGGIEQRINLDPYPKWKITFRGGNNPNLWCNSLDHYSGHQSFKVLVGQKGDNGLAKELVKDFNLGVANKQSGENKRMLPNWKSFSIEYDSKKYGTVNRRPFLQFISTSQEGKACGALITDVKVEPIIE